MYNANKKLRKLETIKSVTQSPILIFFTTLSLCFKTR